MKMNKFENLAMWEKLQVMLEFAPSQVLLHDILQWLPTNKANDILQDIASAYDIDYYYNLENE